VGLARVADGAAGPEDWAAFRRLAEADPGVWEEVADLRRHEAALSRAVEAAGSIAEAVELPHQTWGEETFHRRLSSARAWGGWAAAAALLLVLTLGGLPEAGNALHPGPRAGTERVGRPAAPSGLAPGSEAALVAGASDPEDAFQRYLAAGRASGSVVGEVPDRVLLESRPLADGSGVELLYLRQVLERRTVPADQVYQMAEDETGAVRPVRASVLPGVARPL